MALTPTEEAQTRALLAQQAQILSLASEEPAILSSLGTTDVNLSQLPSALSIADADIMLLRQGTTDKSVPGTVLKGFANSFIQSGTGAVTRTNQDKLRETVSIKDFGAVCDGIVDDSAAVQLAVNYCLSFSQAKTLLIPGKTKIVTPIIIDRTVDTTTSEFRIIGAGSGAGFYCTTAINIFESTLAVTTDPKSEFVTFENIHFECQSGATAAYVLSKKFLRIKFLNCYFLKIRCMTSDIYVQSIRFTDCNIRYWTGVFLNADRAFDIVFDCCVAEFGATLTLFPNGFYNVRYTNNLLEGSTGGFVYGGAASSLLISGNYIEGNEQLAIALNYGAANNSVVIEGNFISSTTANAANINFYEIAWGICYGAVSKGNISYNARLHDNSLMSVSNSLNSTGDTAALGLYKSPLFVTESSGQWFPATTLGGATVNSATYVRNDKHVHAEFSLTLTAATSGSPLTITGLPYSGVAPIFGGSITYSDLTGNLFVLGGTTFASSPTAFKISSDRQGTAITYTTAASKTFTGYVSYII